MPQKVSTEVNFPNEEGFGKFIWSLICMERELSRTKNIYGYIWYVYVLIRTGKHIGRTKTGKAGTYECTYGDRKKLK